MARLLAAEATPQVHLVLAGGGHTHALVLRRWAMHPRRRPRAWITLVSRHSTTLYSGMVPGLVAGLYGPEECSIDLRRLADQAGVSFVEAEITGVDPAGGRLLLEGRPPLRFDWLSLDVGSVVGDPGPQCSSDATTLGQCDENDTTSDLRVAETLQPLPVKPLEPFLAWSSGAHAGRQEPVTVVGSGAAAVEIALALKAVGHSPNLQRKPGGLTLGSRHGNRILASLLAEAEIPVKAPVPPHGDATGAPAPTGAVSISCTGSRGPSWLAGSGLPVDQRGRVRTSPTLQVEGHPRLFACGDCGVVARDPRPPSGVWAVRAAPVLAANLERALRGASLLHWRPQPRALQLIGDGGFKGQPRAVALWGPLAVGPSRWLWRWKDRIDRRFLERFQQMGSMEATGPLPCRGCAAKVAAEPLQTALQRLGHHGLSMNGQPLQAEDAALVGQGPSGELLLQSVDGFPALMSDPWLNGRLTTLHACSDLWASGARVTSAQAIVTLPVMGPELQADVLHQTLAGVRSVLDPLGAQLAGGHTMEARDTRASGPGMTCAGLALTLTVNGETPAEAHWTKGPLQSGDVLILTRPIGTGVLFAAAMAGAAKTTWIDGALTVMQQSQAELVALLRAHGCHACTDITGFGLLGHLGEMLGPSTAANPAQERTATLRPHVILNADAIPAFPGALELLGAGYQSTLAPSNARALALLGRELELVGNRALKTCMQGLLVDPQTCGPLLAAIPASQGSAAVRALRAWGYPDAAVVGAVSDAVLT